MSRRNRIPVPGASLPARGASGSWLFKRSASHFHQGLDIGGIYGGDHPVFRDKAAYHKARMSGKLDIQSVTDGVITKIVRTDSGTSYGRIIVVKSRVNGRDLWFLYAHLAPIDARLREKQSVHEGQVIAHVGHSGNAGSANPHLHFEVATNVLPTRGGPDFETTPTIQRRRIDPYAVLEELGPFSGKQAFFVTGKPVTPTEVTAQHLAVETSPGGGFFPLGANNIWHGGVHITTSAGSTLVAPFDGEIVAVRLDPNPATAGKAFGSCNFVLMRHEISERLYNAMRQEHGGKSDPAFIGPEAPGIDEDQDEDPHAEGEDLDHDGDCCGDAEGHLLDSDVLEGEGEEEEEDDDDDPTGQNDDDGTDPPTPDDPDPPPPEPEHPERVVFSLLMHVGAEPLTDALTKTFPWLTAVRVDAGDIPPPSGAEEAKAAFTAHEEDQAEAESHRIAKKVGAGVGKELDIAWVEKRLIRFELLDKATGKEGEALTEAIKAFQAKHVFGEGSSKITGVVRAGQRTDQKLRKTRRDLGLDPTPAGPKTLDPMFVARTGNLDSDDVAEVISGLRIPVRAGNPLWMSDRARGFNESGTTSLKDQVHWEIFSEEQIFIDGVDGWGSIDDPNEDLTTDAPQALIDLIDKPTATTIPPMAKGPDGIISLAELTAFYGSPASTFLRRRQCRFRAEWGLDLDAAIDALVETFPNIDTLRDDLVPYQWWQHAAKSLPSASPGKAKTHVWHYNPIEFIGLYQLGLDAIAPPPKKDPRKFGDVQVTVVNKQGGRLGRVKLTLTDATGKTHTAKTKGPDGQGRGGGEVTFFDIPKGTARLTAQFKHKGQAWDHPESEHEVKAAKAEDDPFVLTEIPLAADVDGDPPPRGKVRATVRLFGAIHKPPVVVEVVNEANVVIQKGATSAAVVTLDDLPFGNYKVRCQDGGSDVHPVVIDRKSPRKVTLNRFRPGAKLKVRVIHKGVGVDGVEVMAATAPNNLPAVNRFGATDPSGEVIFDVFVGPYTVKVGKISKQKKVVEGKLNELIINTKSPPPPTLTGILLVRVPAVANNTGSVELCRASHPDAPVLTAVPVEGMAEFVTEPGSYIARFDGKEVAATITAGITTEAEIEP